ncbi:bifunctional phosphopantothenoylcysteine decarboxylase/phosphopantothenate--cysteine ligase CoaBC [Neotabrizicola sp. sgz301269]|uniref:bifunctional phosphopantothenoylcysteine decarboxylase/phosphopantothenate--cysteine ligase CoaBC n=1 Tax=Neotabrizicola sp. sgz301269 TaxID=3276282 RepID=UPI003770281D
MLADKRILLIIGGGIAAYKALDLIRRLRERGARVRAVMTQAAQQFITPLSVGALTADHVFTDLFDRQDEQDVGHIRLAREADLIVVAPATADLMAKLANGLANDLASAILLATDKTVLIAPAMNPRMWSRPATLRNRATLAADGVLFIGPARGEMAEAGEAGEGRMAEPLDIVAAAEAALGGGPLAGRHVLVTSGPTHEPIDPVRYIANRSSGAQGTALAAALRDLGARVTFITGPATVPPPQGVAVVSVETAREMLDAVQAALPADAAVMAAAVADWRVANQGAQKMKKDGSGRAPALEFAENPDILATVSKGAQRPRLVVGFAAETEKVVDHASAKRLRKGCDWIVANDVSPATGIMGGAENAVTLISAAGAETWERMPKAMVARRLAERIAEALA